MAKQLCHQAGYDTETRYLNWDAAEDRENILIERFPAGPGYLILDEIHKYSRWRFPARALSFFPAFPFTQLFEGSLSLRAGVTGIT